MTPNCAVFIYEAAHNREDGCIHIRRAQSSKQENSAAGFNLICRSDAILSQQKGNKKHKRNTKVVFEQREPQWSIICFLQVKVFSWEFIF